LFHVAALVVPAGDFHGFSLFVAAMVLVPMPWSNFYDIPGVAPDGCHLVLCEILCVII
jgi:hypothetical protein